jgi:hypothetical protein
VVDGVERAPRYLDGQQVEAGMVKTMSDVLVHDAGYAAGSGVLRVFARLKARGGWLAWSCRWEEGEGRVIEGRKSRAVLLL